MSSEIHDSSSSVILESYQSIRDRVRKRLGMAGSDYRIGYNVIRLTNIPPPDKVGRHTAKHRHCTPQEIAVPLKQRWPLYNNSMAA